MTKPQIALLLIPFALTATLLLAADPPATATSQPSTHPIAAEVYTAWPFDAKEAARRQDETAKALAIPKLLTVDLAGVPIKFILIPAGKYQDDSKKDLTVEKPFYMAQYKTSQLQYQKITGKNPSAHKAPDLPVDSVNCADATEFCQKASEKTRKKFALATELQWEHACRAGTATRCYWGNDMAKMGDYCWWHDNCMTPDGKGPTHPGGQKLPNAFTLYDMMGNVWEWTADGGPDAKEHYARGATFGSKEPMFKSSTRWPFATGAVLNDRFGMRVILELD